MKRALRHTRLLLDVFSIRVLVWLLGANGELLDSHLFFYDKYSALAEIHELNGRSAKAARCTAIAEAFYDLAPDDDDTPKSAAMATPIPRSFVRTDAIGKKLPPRSGVPSLSW
jgi:hypothetical protein